MMGTPQRFRFLHQCLLKVYGKNYRKALAEDIGCKANHITDCWRLVTQWRLCEMFKIMDIVGRPYGDAKRPYAGMDIVFPKDGIDIETPSFPIDKDVLREAMMELLKTG